MQFESAYTNCSGKNFELNCDHCGKNFTKAFNLMRHMNHTKYRIEFTNYTAVNENEKIFKKINLN